MFDCILNAVAAIYEKAADRELTLATAAGNEKDYETSAYHLVEAIKLMEYRDHEVLDMPYDDKYEKL